MTGGGKDLKNQTKSTNYLYKISSFVKFYIKKILAEKTSIPSDRRIKKILDATSRCRGAILIEFAVCMPILIILLFYINDVVRLKRLHSQTEFVAQQMVNIIQNISQKREGADRKINCDDIRYAASLAYLSMFPGTSRFTITANRTHTSDFGYNGLGYIFCVKGNPDSTASVLWARRFHLADGSSDPSHASVDTSVKRTNVKNLIDASPSEIYPTLKIKPDEIKIIIECAVHYSRSQYYFFTDGRKTADVTHSEAFGLRLLELSAPKTRDGEINGSVCFHSAVIFTPKPGLFDETPPE